MKELPTADVESRAVRAAAGPDQVGRRSQGEAEARPEFAIQRAEQGTRPLKVPRRPCLPRRVCVPPAKQIQRHDRGWLLHGLLKANVIKVAWGLIQLCQTQPSGPKVDLE